MATIRVKNPNLGGEKWITIPTKILSEADHIVTNKGQGDLYLSNDGTYKDVIKSANDYTDKLIELITGSSPDILETLKELSNQTSDNKDFIDVLNKSIATKLDKTANAVSASKLAEPIKLWGNDFDGSQSIYSNLYASNGNLGLSINNNNVVLGNNTNPSYIYGNSLMVKTGTDAVSIYVDSEGKVGIGTANPLKGLHINEETLFDLGLIAMGLNLDVITLHREHDNGSSAILFTNNTNKLGYLGIAANSKPYYWDGHGVGSVLLHSDNFSDYALSLNGGIIQNTSNSPLRIGSTSTGWSGIAYSNKNGINGYIGVWHNGDPVYVPVDLSTAYVMLHEKNYSNYALPITGGTVNGKIKIVSIEPGSLSIDRTNDVPLIKFSQDSNTYGYIGVLPSGPIFKDRTLLNIYNIYHEGNDGADSGLDADKLDGKHASDFYDLTGGIEIPEGANLNDYLSIGTYYLPLSNRVPTLSNCPIDEAFVLLITNPTGTNAYLKQELIGWNSHKVMSRIYSSVYRTWGEWCVTGENLETYNAPTATKLATPVKLWGLTFDGTKDVDGDIFNVKTINGSDTKSLYLRQSGIPSGIKDLKMAVGIGTAQDNYGTFIWGTRDGIGHIQTGRKDEDETSYDLILQEFGSNVGIGTTGPQYKLDIESPSYNVMRLKSVNNSVNEVSIVYVTPNNKQWVTGVGVGATGDSFSFYSKTASSAVMTINSNGFVGINNTSPLCALDVNGTANFSENIFIKNSSIINFFDTENIAQNVMRLNQNNDFSIGYGVANSGYNTYIDGNNLYFRYGTLHDKGITLNSSGNVTIGSSDLAGDAYKLYVDGTTRFTNAVAADAEVLINANAEGIYLKGSSIMTHDANNKYVAGAINFSQNGNVHFAHTVTVNDNLNVSNSISGDLVDWYGVSWSENDSSPTCTRIGNMALHRSLPILNAMKGYFIHTTNTHQKEQICPMKNDWSGVSYYPDSNLSSNTSTFKTGSTMVKIPEFWYIDDYEPETKTHNLKISQTAKAGWCHHKEAYVGAYEGYNDGTYYRSTKGVIPTVSVTRETIRTKARANGYEDEYKWNIYTYEEHRAICHLFLVEYATRNSQLAVNPELTSDGFKQGGLGSGCTTGTVTINGATKYSFIPTGTTDSLGNGSGQVAYTVTQTDADGNETGTVTRYANRYRGIENPFGHIWKHVDDIANVYNADTTYKTVYKCNKPEHFATNKNAKYKPLCSFPGGSKMQGYSKEIKATINCDFFRYSVGGSESTYWCDYNYDNDDTSEHCLLIGGSSGDGGLAGLFGFNLRNGVGLSSVSIGSRLTYLPWAE